MLVQPVGHLVLALTDSKLSGIIRDAFLQELYKVSVVTDGEATIRFLTENPGTELLLIDSDLPGLNGYETVQFLRASGHSQLIILLMAWFSLQSLATSNLVGCDEFIAKPVDVANLIITASQQLLNRQAISNFHKNL